MISSTEHLKVYGAWLFVLCLIESTDTMMHELGPHVPMQLGDYDMHVATQV